MWEVGIERVLTASTGTVARVIEDRASNVLGSDKKESIAGTRQQVMNDADQSKLEAAYLLDQAHVTKLG